MSYIGLALLSMFLGGLALGIPIAVAMGLACVMILIWQELPIAMLAQQMVGTAHSFTFIAIPAYLLLGALMERSGLVERLIDFCMAVVGWVRGGLSLVATLVSMIFAGISGSASADTAAVGSVMIPALKRSNYGPGYSAALLSASGSIGIVIPPSIPMIIYGLATGTPIPALFLAGYIPGLLLGAAFMTYSYFVARRGGLGVVQEFSIMSLGRAFRRAFLALLAPVIIIGSVVSAIVTPTESAIIGIAYVLFLGVVVYRKLTATDLFTAFLQAASLSAVIMFMIMTSTMFGWIVARENIPGLLAQAVLNLTSSKIMILLCLNAVVLIGGMLIDTVALLIILIPVVLPIALSLGMDPVHFGVLFVVNMAIGLMTPPVGYCLFISSAIAKISLGEVIRKVWMFVGISLIVLLLVTFLEPVTMLIPNMFYGG